MQLVPLTLEDVFSFWRANEAWNPKWQKVAQEKGFASWEAWRRKFLSRLEETTEPEWVLEELTNPLEQVPQWHGGPFAGWIKNVYQGQSSMPFTQIIEQSFMRGHDYIPGLVKNFPKLTVLTLVEDASGKILVVEGMHRACALAVMVKEGKQLGGRVFAARGKLKIDKELIFDIQV